MAGRAASRPPEPAEPEGIQLSAHAFPPAARSARRRRPAATALVATAVLCGAPPLAQTRRNVFDAIALPFVADFVAGDVNGDGVDDLIVHDRNVGSVRSTTDRGDGS